DFCALHSIHSHAASTNDDTMVAGLYLSGMHCCPISGWYSTTKQRSYIKRDIFWYHYTGGCRNNRKLGECAEKALCVYSRLVFKKTWVLVTLLDIANFHA